MGLSFWQVGDYFYEAEKLSWFSGMLVALRPSL